MTCRNNQEHLVSALICIHKNRRESFQHFTKGTSDNSSVRISRGGPLREPIPRPRGGSLRNPFQGVHQCRRFMLIQRDQRGRHCHARFFKGRQPLRTIGRRFRSAWQQWGKILSPSFHGDGEGVEGRRHPLRIAREKGQFRRRGTEAKRNVEDVILS
ncbi:hypothetical protein CEXT_190231 [Caerostris extrusa]|uniref:Uncharacterized protein n=1 Tax=Caerostris extrusa TaxID=172846 RepID=A0AAV4RGR7_CAEEX|nr:hypothetical protein CEXT_190231 [Caerostris extrusa]